MAESGNLGKDEFFGLTLGVSRCLTFQLAASKLQVAKRKTTKLTIVRTRSRKKDRLALARF